MRYLVESADQGEVAYKTRLIDIDSLKALANPTAMRILKTIGEDPSCALDVARKLDINEQKVYYHIRKLKDASVIKLIRKEERTGGTAKIYALTSSIVAIKLNNEGFKIPNKSKAKELDRFQPFIKDGNLNAKIILGDPYPHGKYDHGGLDGCYVADLALFLGNLLGQLTFPCYLLDTRVTEEDLKDNLIVIGGPKCNTITHQLNSKVPVFFDEENEWAIVSKTTGKIYRDDLAGLILKCENPYNEDKKVLLLAGRRTRGTQASVIAFTQYFDKVIDGNEDNKTIAKVVHGVDTNGDGVIDSVKFLE